jgi:anti-sigma regulatory factor (Ser/Thr protein kinase)
MATVQTRDIPPDSGEHVVQFYEHDSELVEMVGPYLQAAARAGEVAIVIATDAHRRAFEAALEAGGVDVAQASADGSLIALDAADTMAAFIADGEIDHGAFHDVIGGLVRRAASSGREIRAYGEMVALLWDAGDVLAAIELEGLWNELAGELRFSLFCSYPAASVAGSEHAEALHTVCHMHSAVFQHPRLAHGTAVTDQRTQTLTASFAAERDSPGRARRLVVAEMREWGYDDALVHEVALVLSELASNAVIHASSAFSIALSAEDSMLRVAVQDDEPLPASRGETPLIARAGHGLAVVEALAARWGVEAMPEGKVVWAELRCAPAHA